MGGLLVPAATLEENPPSISPIVKDHPSQLPPNTIKTTSSRLDRVELALLPNEPSPPEKRPRHRHQCQRDEAEQAARPADAQIAIHCRGQPSMTRSRTGVEGVHVLWTTNNGNAPASRYRAKLFALVALAIVVPRYTSTRYCMVLTNRQMFPHANGMMATTGLAHDTSTRAVHPNQNSPSGMPRLPIMAG